MPPLPFSWGRSGGSSPPPLPRPHLPPAAASSRYLGGAPRSPPAPRGRTGGAERAGPRRGGVGGRPAPPVHRLPPSHGGVFGFFWWSTPPAALGRGSPAAKGTLSIPVRASAHAHNSSPRSEWNPRGCLSLLARACKKNPKAYSTLSSFPSITDSPPVFSAAEVTFP